MTVCAKKCDFGDVAVLVIAHFYFGIAISPGDRSAVRPYVYLLGKVSQPVILHYFFRYTQSIRSWLAMFSQRNHFEYNSQFIK